MQDSWWQEKTTLSSSLMFLGITLYIVFWGCMGFDVHTGSCTKRTGHLDSCSCEMQSPGVHRLTYTKTATLNSSKGMVYFVWPGEPDLRSRNYTLPEVRAKEGGYMREFIGIGVVVSLAFIASIAAIHYFHGKKASTAVVQSSSRAVNNLSSPISASRETQQEGQDDPGDTTNSGPTKVPSQTDATPVNNTSTDIH
ncbi:hypothetical protein RRG08_056967 [Elysia crispata]|uniref:Uncharacterized protein n=1 Tax=Elysia crispata TaxID=231223 RepID=A0AAE1D9V3_9GAST|nr:hypothetical protein RRG08_056967 [Elysia crispata]